MTTVAPAPNPAPDVRRRSTEAQETLTPTLGAAFRRRLPWIVLALVIVIVAVVVVAGIRGASIGVPLSPTDATPAGSKALAEVLEQQGVDVVPTSSLDDTDDAVISPDETTILVIDDDLILDDGQLRRLGTMATRLVVVSPDSLALAAIAPEIATAGEVSGVEKSDCSLPAVENAGAVVVDGPAYRVIDDDADAEACLGSDDAGYSVIALEEGDTVVTVVGARAAFANESIARQGDAALALTLLGATDTLVWYLPSSADLADGPPASIESLLPGWYSPVIATLLLAGIAAAVWRGRRLGPLVVENLPVTVRASETMEGRARLYQRGSTRLHALDSLRIGAVGRLAKTCGLPRLATVAEVVEAVAAITGRPRQDVSRILVDAVPDSDADLVALSDQLLVLERDTTVAATPGRMDA